MNKVIINAIHPSPLYDMISYHDSFNYHPSNYNPPSSGLDLLLSYHKLTGNTYFHWKSNDETTPMKRIMLNLWNVVFILYITCYSIYCLMMLFRDKDLEKELGTHKTRLVFILYLMGEVGFLCEVIIASLMLFFRGQLGYLYLKNNCFIKDEKEQNAGIKILILQIALTFALQVPYYIAALIQHFFGGRTFTLEYILIFYINCFILLNNKMTIISVMAYMCYNVSHRIDEITENFNSLKNLDNIYREVMQVKNAIKRANKFGSNYHSFIFSINSLIIISCLCVLYIEPMQRLDITLGDTIECISIILIICMMSNKINSNYTKLLEKFEELEEKNFGVNKLSIDHSLVNRLYALKDDMCLTAINLYKINTKTLITILLHIITFTAILIQM